MLDDLMKGSVTWGDRPATSTSGQVPGRNQGQGQGVRIDPEIERALRERSPDWDIDRHFEIPVIDVRDTVSGLGLSPALEETLSRVIRREVDSALNVMQLRRNLMAKLQTEAFPSDIRQTIVSRAVRYFVASMQKSGVSEIYTPDELWSKAEAHGGSYYRRVPRDDGKHRYFYSKEDYDRHGGRHIEGAEARTTFIKNALYRKTCKSGGVGCAVEEFRNLTKRFGAQAVYEAAKALTDEQQIFFKGARFYPSESKNQDPKSAKRAPASRQQLRAEVSSDSKGVGGRPSRSESSGGSRKFELKSKAEKSGRFHIVEDRLTKAALPVGIVRDWRGGRYQKVAEGKWRPVMVVRDPGPKAPPEVGTDAYSELPWSEVPPKGFLPPAPPGEGQEGSRGGTEQMHWDASKRAYRPERQSLHDEIVASSFLNKTPVPEGQRIAIVMMGGTASGKSTMLKQSGAGGVNFVHVDADDVKARLPEYRVAVGQKWQGAAAFVHEESSTIARRVATQAVQDGYNVVLDGTGANASKFFKQVQMLKDAGYHVHLMMPDQNKDQALSDAMKRANRTGRYVPPEFIEAAYAKIPGNFFKVAAMADSAQLYDRRRDGKLVWEKSASGEEVAHDPEFLKTYPNYSGAK